jgi:xylulokinase
MPTWDLGEVTHHSTAATPDVMQRYKELKEKTLGWS